MGRASKGRVEEWFVCGRCAGAGGALRAAGLGVRACVRFPYAVCFVVLGSRVRRELVVEERASGGSGTVCHFLAVTLGARMGCMAGLGRARACGG